MKLLLNTRYLLSFFLILIFVGIVSGCHATEKALYSGNYDTVIKKMVNKLTNGKQNDKHVLLLEDAFNKANARDIQYLNGLKRAGDPNNYEKIYNYYVHLQDRQRKIAPLLPLYVVSENNRKADFAVQDYSAEITNAKNNYAEYLYVSAQNLLRSNSKVNAREAYVLLKKLDKHYPNFRDVGTMQQNALESGMLYVLLKVDNRTGAFIPQSFIDEAIRIDRRQLNSKWVHYDYLPLSNRRYDYEVHLLLNGIEASPEHVRESLYTDEKEVIDSWKYQRDTNGKFVLDSLGNKIKDYTYKIIRADVALVEQHKAMRVSGNLAYFDIANGDYIHYVPVFGEAAFNNRYGVMQGNLEALSEASKKLINGRPLPFPTDADMILQCSATMQNAVVGALKDNAHYIK